MFKTIKNAAIVLSILLIFLLALFVINQTVEVTELASRLSPGFGKGILWFLICLYTALILWTVMFFVRLPKPLIPPQSETEPQFSEYLEILRKRLSANPRLRGCDLSNRAGIKKALEDLGRECDVVIREHAEAVFVSTAISQSGRLDTIFVLAANFRMIWRIVGIYAQRPALRDLINLYANVAATAFMAGELDEAEISSQIEPILSSALGAISLSVPGVQAASAIVISSILTGTANAFLTLRVGVISRSYCGALFLADRKKVRLSATAESAKMLGSIVKSGTARISKSLWHASMGKVGGAFSGLTGIARDMKDSLFTLLKKVGENSKNTETDLH